MGDRHDRSESDAGLLDDDGRPVDAADHPYDLSLVHADDEYLDLLAGADLDAPDGVPDDQLTRLLISWRRDVESEPIGDLVDTKLATVTVQAARVRDRRRPRLLVPVAVVAAVLAIVFAGVGLAARGAHPGDTLWALTKVLYADHARSVEAAEEVRADLHEAKVALTEGDVAEAKSRLEDAHAALPTVASEDGQADLEAQHASLVAQLPGIPSDEASPPPSANPTTAPEPGSGGTDAGSGTEAPPASTQPQTTPSPSSPPSSTTPPSSSSTSQSGSDTGTPNTGETEAERESAMFPGGDSGLSMQTEQPTAPAVSGG